tara:strand:+ start:314 stop:1012 length:699 start_codon:yes stop_codon:yes gene_type:complete
MYWSRRWKVHNCKPCNYIGVSGGAKSVPQSSSSYMKKFKDSVERDPWGRNCCDHQGALDYKKYKIIPDDRLYENVYCPKERTNKYLIKSGQQPNKNEPLYSYGYNDYLKNKRKMTYDMKLPTSKGDDIYGHGGKCDSNVINNCNMAKTTAKFSNKKYYKQGAVDSSSRIDRLRYNTIVGSKKCNGNSKCNGIYPNASGRRKDFNKIAASEFRNCPQHIARRKALGVYNSIYQ